MREESRAPRSAVGSTAKALVSEPWKVPAGRFTTCAIQKGRMLPRKSASMRCSRSAGKTEAATGKIGHQRQAHRLGKPATRNLNFKMGNRQCAAGGRKHRCRAGETFGGA